MDLPDINEMSLREAALAYAALHIRVLPLRPNRKDPLPGGHGVKEATADRKQIEQWWEEDPTRNIGITVPGTILDIDLRYGGKETWESLVQRFGRDILSSTLQITPTGGMHVFFAPSPALVELHGIDVVRPGKYVVASPSVHPDGGTYQWYKNASTKTRLLEIPRQLVQGEKKLTGSSEEPHGEGYARAALRNETAALRDAAPGTRNNVLNSAAYKLARFIQTKELTERDITENLLAAARAAGLSEFESRRTIQSALKAIK